MMITNKEIESVVIKRFTLEKENIFFSYDKENDKEVFSYGESLLDYFRLVEQYLGEDRGIVDKWEQSKYFVEEDILEINRIKEKTTQSYQDENVEKKYLKYKKHKDILKRKLARGGRANILFLLTECIHYVPVVNTGKNQSFRSVILRESEEVQGYCWGYERCKEVEEHRNGYGDFWARGHLKTTIITEAMNIQEIINNPNVSIGIKTHDMSLAKNIISRIRSQLYNITWIYPDILEEKKGEKRKSNRDSQMGFSVPGCVSGRFNVSPISPKGGSTGSHFEIIVYDDLMTADMKGNPEKIQLEIDQIDATFNLNSVADKRSSTKRRFIGTYYSLTDIYHLLQKRNDNKGVYIPRIRHATESKTIDGKLLFFARTQWIQTTEDTAMSEADKSSQYLLKPLGASEGECLPLWNPSFFQPKNLMAYENITPYIIVDPAYTTNKYSDYTAIVVVGKSKYNTIHVYHIERVKVPFTSIYYILKDLSLKYKPANIFVEGKGTTELQLLYSEGDKNNYALQLTEIKSGLPKNKRIQVLGEKSKENCIFFRKDMSFLYVNEGVKKKNVIVSGMEVLKNEWDSWEFSNKKNRDDVLDALAYCFFIDSDMFKYDPFYKIDNNDLVLDKENGLEDFDGYFQKEKESLYI